MSWHHCQVCAKAVKTWPQHHGRVVVDHTHPAFIDRWCRGGGLLSAESFQAFVHRPEEP